MGWKNISHYFIFREIKIPYYSLRVERERRTLYVEKKRIGMENRIELERRGLNPEVVTELNLDNCRSLNIVGLTKDYKNLEVLSLINVGLTSLKGLPILPNLRKVELSDNRISSGLENLLKASGLTHLSLSGNKIKDFDSLMPLAKLDQLKSLDLFNCEVTTEKDYRAKVFELIPQLKYLDGTDREEKELEESEDEEEIEDEEDEIDDEDGLDEDGLDEEVDDEDDSTEDDEEDENNFPGLENDEEDYDEEEEEDEEEEMDRFGQIGVDGEDGLDEEDDDALEDEEEDDGPGLEYLAGKEDLVDEEDDDDEFAPLEDIDGIDNSLNDDDDDEDSDDDDILESVDDTRGQKRKRSPDDEDGE